jgi:hypothetical protein
VTIFASDKAHLDESLHQVVVTDGVARWDTNDRCLFEDAAEYYRDAHGLPIDLDAQVAAKTSEDAAAIAAYVRNQPAIPSAEERYEMEAAFGPGVKVVDVFSGRTYTTGA